MTTSWSVRNARITLLGAPVELGLKELYGVTIETELLKHGAKQVLRSGTFGPGTLSIGSNPTRTDIVWQCNPSEAGVAYLGEMSEVYETLLKPLSGAVAQLEAVPRVALAGIMGIPCATAVEAAGLIMSEMPWIPFDRETTLDLELQFNRIVTARIDGESISFNRVTKFETTTFVNGQFELTPHGELMPREGESRFEATCTLDMSNRLSAETPSLPKGLAVHALEYLASIAAPTVLLSD